jgi:hypothetical protein
MGFSRDLGGPLAGKTYDNPSSIAGIGGYVARAGFRLDDRSAGLIKDIAFLLSQGGEVRVKICGVPRRSDKVKELFLWAARKGFVVTQPNYKRGFGAAGAQCRVRSLINALRTARRCLKLNGWCYVPDSILAGMQMLRDKREKESRECPIP